MSRTTLILGAGASRPFGFPTAMELREIIVHKKYGKVVAILKDLGAPLNLWDITGNHLKKWHGRPQLDRLQSEFFQSQKTSIDRFVQQRGNLFDEIARNALAAIFLQCEASAYLNRDWYGILRDAILQNGPDRLPNDRLQIVTFN